MSRFETSRLKLPIQYIGKLARHMKKERRVDFGKSENPSSPENDAEDGSISEPSLDGPRALVIEGAALVSKCTYNSLRKVPPQNHGC